MGSAKNNYKVHIYADGANKDDMIRQFQSGLVQGFTTNPSLMVKGGVKDYEKFAREMLEVIKEPPISFEVFADDFGEMKRQALKIKTWGANVNVKIPITNTKRESALPLIKELLAEGLKLNVTAMLTVQQVKDLAGVMKPQDDVIVSVFAGRVADTGVDPEPLMSESAKLLTGLPKAKLLWASSREVFNILQADRCGCKIITVTDDILKKLSLHHKNLDEYSLDTVKMFYEDAKKAGFKL